MKKIKKRYIVVPIIILAITVIIFGVVNMVKISKRANAEIENNEFSNEEGEADSDKVLDGQHDVIVAPVIDETIDNPQEVPEEQQQKEEPKAQQTTQSTSKPSAQQKKEIKYFIRVNYNQNVVTIYTKDANGNYTVPYKVMVCSSGRATPRSGTYTMPSGSNSKGVWGLMVGNVWAQYFTRIKGSILFHSVPYTQRNKWSLEYWEYDKLGTTASAGCIRLTVQDAKWIYDNCPSGTQVEFYSDSNPGPLGKPTAQKISSEEAVRGWDPTDPAGNNPWKTYIKEESKEEVKEEQEEQEKEQITIEKPELPKQEEIKPTVPEKPKEEITPEKPEEPKQEIIPTNPEASEQEKENEEKTQTENVEKLPSETTKQEDKAKEEITEDEKTNEEKTTEKFT